MLLDKDATTVNQARTDNGVTPLLMACWNGYEEVVRLLLAQAATKVNQKNNSGNTPIDVACEKNQTKIVELLLADSRTKRINLSDRNYYEVYNQALRNVISKRNARFRGLIRAAIVFRQMRIRAALKVYALEGAGFHAASASFAAAIDR